MPEKKFGQRYTKTSATTPTPMPGRIRPNRPGIGKKVSAKTSPARIKKTGGM